MNKRQNPLGIRAGDTVRIHFEHDNSSPFLAEVTKVTDRATMGYDAHIDFVPEESGRNLEAERLKIPYGCSVSHVREIVKRAPYRCEYKPPVNVFRNEIECVRGLSRHDSWPGYYTFGGIRVTFSDMDRLIVLALASAKETLDRPLDIERFQAMWAKDKYRGRVTLPYHPMFDEYRASEKQPYTAVRWKVFKAYVLANRHRILSSRKEMEKAGREANEAMWRESAKDFEKDFDEHFDIAQSDASLIEPYDRQNELDQAGWSY